jgi:outer membrane protein assembly factor BamB
MIVRRIVFAAALLALLQGCGGSKDTAEPPAKLTDFDATLDVQKVWSNRVGGASERLRLGLRPATDGARVYAGAYDGKLASYDAATGRREWSVGRS